MDVEPPMATPTVDQPQPVVTDTMLPPSRHKVNKIVVKAADEREANGVAPIQVAEEPAAVESTTAITAVDQFGDVRVPRIGRALSFPRLPRRFRQNDLSPTIPASPPLPIVDVEARLQDEVAAMNLDVGLDDFLKFVSQLSTIPLIVSPEALQYSQVGLETSIHLVGQDATVAGMLREALTPLRLGYRVEPGYLLIERCRN